MMLLTIVYVLKFDLKKEKKKKLRDVYCFLMVSKLFRKIK